MTARSSLLVSALALVPVAAVLLALQAPAYCAALAPGGACAPDAGPCLLCVAVSLLLAALAVQLALASPAVVNLLVVAVVWHTAAHLCRSVL